MRKVRLYLDTSVVSHIFADDTPERMADTIALWEELKLGKFDIFVSETTLFEIDKCDEPKRTKMLMKLKEINYTNLTETQEVNDLAKAYIDKKVLTIKSLDDCMHIAFGVISQCDIIVSWNFKHLVNYKTIGNIKIVNAINLYKEIEIMTPSMIIGGQK